ncbi:ABC transporter ATP-binding protein [Corynebacterium aquilae DSM 44791]|uniref:ABC transporter ATP-binding protein n=2 Tax=Corynebacterium aquilae TaxID=203263 RepID=A0A1L7CF66_9CORY|nr:ABC transporter ATP-binding protein [Corynebacterium aquilae DSM 44791]
MKSQPPSQVQGLQTLLSMLALEKRAGVLAMVFTLLVTATETIAPLVTRDAIDVATGAGDGGVPARLLAGFSPLSATIAVFLLLAVARYATQFGRRWQAGKLSIGMQHTLRVQAMDRLLAVDGPRQDELSTGQVASRAISDITTLQAIAAVLPLASGVAVKVVAMVVVMFVLNPWLALVALVSLPIIVFSASLSRTTLFAATWSAQQKAADLTTRVEEAITGVRVVKAFAQESREVDTIERMGREVFAHRMRAAKMTARFQPALDQLPLITLVINVAVGGYLTLHGAISVGTFVAFTAYLMTLTSSTRMLAGVAVRLQLAMSSVERVREVLSLSPEVDDSAVQGDLPDGPLGVRVDRVSFSTRGRQVLRDVSVEVPAGSSVALIGPPGAGKTMLVQLLGDFYRPDSGTLALTTAQVGAESQRVDYGTVPRALLRKAVVCVFDDAWLMSDTVRNNICLGADIDEQSLLRATDIAQATEFIEQLPDGFDTVLGERGLTLSGGQRQRIALARAIVRNPRVLVLDDATSAIDASTEAKILAGLHDELDNVTIISVAHRESTVRLADAVVVLDDGAVTARGPVDEMASSPEFSALMATRPVVVDEDGEPVPFDAGEEPPASKLWPDDTEDLERAAKARQRPKPARGGGGGGGRPHGKGGPGMPAIAATPQLMKKVTELPPADEDPAVDADYWRHFEGPLRPWAMLSTVKGLILTVVVLLIVGVGADLAFPALMRIAIDAGVGQQQTRALWTISVAGIAIVAISWVAAVGQTIFAARTGERLLFTLRLRSYAHLQRLSLSYFEKNRAGSVLTRMTTDIDSLTSFLQTGLAQALVSAGTLVGVSAIMLTLDVELALIALGVIPIVVIATNVFRKISSKLYAQARKDISAVNADFQEALGGLRPIQAYGAGDFIDRRFVQQAEKYRATRLRSQRVIATYFTSIAFVNMVVEAIILFVGARLVERGEITAGTLVSAALYLGLLLGPIQQLSQTFDGYQQARVSLGRIAELLTTGPDVHDAGQRSDARSHADGDIALDNVTFSYGVRDTPALDGVNVTIEPGSSVAVVGPTGAGKSTIIKLLTRFYDPTTGAVTASGVDIRDFTIDSWHHALGLVPQEAHLFSGTVADNIAYGRPGADREAITDAARRVGALTAISRIPGGFNHPVGERGAGLSSGQRQLIALARAELVEPQLLLLDEATATLDPATENTILNASDRATSRRTSVIVAHRLATAQRADRILVVKDGRIVEDGTHEELKNAGGTYAAMWHANTSQPQQQ